QRRWRQPDFVPPTATARREVWHSSATSDATDYRGSPHMAEDTLDCSDLDRYLGKPMQPARLREPLGNNDIRRWVQAMHYPNRLHYEDEFAAESRFGGIVAPQSFAGATDEGQGSAPACVGRIPQSHLIFGGDEWWFYGPRIVAGDLIHNERIPFDYVVKQTKFAGPTCFQRG